MPTHRTRTIWIAALLCAACGAPAPKPAPAPAGAPGAAAPTAAAAPKKRPWPAELAREAILIADVVQIEGPEGLIEHVAVRQEGSDIEYKAETTTNGFLQTWTPKPGVEVRGQIDNCVIVAMQRITALERPGATSVEIRAHGAAVYRCGVIEQREAKWSASYPVPAP